MKMMATLRMLCRGLLFSAMFSTLLFPVQDRALFVHHHPFQASALLLFVGMIAAAAWADNIGRKSDGF